MRRSSASTPRKALKAPGVVAVFTGADLETHKIAGLPCGWLITDVNGQPMKEPAHPCLAVGKVRYVGDHVAVVIAETWQQAKDAAELVDVDYEVLPAVVEVMDALKPGARDGPRHRPGQPSATSGRSATRARSTRRSPRPRRSPRSTSSTTG